MKKIFQLSLLMLALLCFFNSDAYGQKKKKKGTKTDQYFDESGGFGHHLWYGGGFTLNFGGSNYASQFVIGVSPMVGYKIFDQLSVGPRVSVSYLSYRYDYGGGQIAKANPLLWSVGAFSRYKIIPAIFLQVEYEHEQDANFYLTGNDIEVQRVGRENFFLGGGYNSSSGGPWGYEISILFNVNAAEDSLEQPFDIRVGLNYNF